MSDAGATAGLQGHQGRGKTRKGECLKQGEEARRHSFPIFCPGPALGLGFLPVFRVVYREKRASCLICTYTRLRRVVLS